MSNPLVAIVCGYERGGTTLVSEILRQHPQLNSGFEGGLLLSDNPHDFRKLEPYVTSLKISWGVNDEELEYICSGAGWQDIFSRLLEKSRNVDGQFIFDKTPKYMEFLPEVMSRVDVPCIVIVRDPRALFFSWAKRSGLSIEDWCKRHLRAAITRYKKYAHGLKSAQARYKERILVVQYESLCENPMVETQRLMEFIGFDFDPAFVRFANPQQNIRENNVSSKFMYEYKNQFSDETCSTITSQLREFKAWFREPAPE